MQNVVYLRERFPSHRLFADLDGRADPCDRLAAEPGRIASLTDYPDLRSVSIS